MGDDILQMQRQAARRVQQMQQHSRRVFEAHQQPEPPTPDCPSAPDNDRLLILGLTLLLYRNGGRPELLLALLYLAM